MQGEAAAVALGKQNQANRCDDGLKLVDVPVSLIGTGNIPPECMGRLMVMNL